MKVRRFIGWTREEDFTFTRRASIQLHALLAVLLVFSGLYGSRETISAVAWPVWLAYWAMVILHVGVITLLPSSWWERQRVTMTVFLVDVSLTTAGLYLMQGFHGDSYLLYFLVILMSGFSRSVQVSVVIGGVAGWVYVWGAAGAVGEPGWLTSALWMRVPFFFVVALICSYFVQMVRREQAQRLEAQSLGRTLYRQVRESNEALVHEHQRFEIALDDWRTGERTSQGVIVWAARLQQRVQVLMRATRDLVIILNEEDRLVEVNPRLEEVLGVPAARLIGQSLHAYVNDPTQHRHFHSRLTLLVKEWQECRMTLPLQSVAGRVVEVEWVFHRFFSKEGRPLIQGIGGVAIPFSSSPVSEQ